MSPRDRVAIRQVVEELTDALQRAIGLATDVRREAQGTADHAVALEAAIGRAVSALRRLQPTDKSGRQ